MLPPVLFPLNIPSKKDNKSSVLNPYLHYQGFVSAAAFTLTQPTPDVATARLPAATHWTMTDLLPGTSEKSTSEETQRLLSLYEPFFFNSSHFQTLQKQSSTRCVHATILCM